MSELEEKLGSILSNPEMMQQIMGLANALNGDQTPGNTQQPSQEVQPSPAQPDLSGLLRGGIDTNQSNLLSALQPYLSRDRITRLERAMHAARMASTASSFLSAGGLNLLTGR